MNPVAGGKRRAAGDECTLEFAITSLDLLVVALLNISLEDTCSRRLVEGGGFQDVCGIDPVVGLASHDVFPLPIGTGELEFPDWVLIRKIRRGQQGWCLCEQVTAAPRATGGEAKARTRGGEEGRTDSIISGREDAIAGTICCCHIEVGGRGGGPGWRLSQSRARDPKS